MDFSDFDKENEEANAFVKAATLDSQSYPQNRIKISRIEQTLQKFVIAPHSRFKKYWNVVVSWLLIYTATVFPYKLCFLSFRIPENPGDLPEPLDDNLVWDVISVIVDLLFWMDLVICFFSSYYDSEGQIVSRFKCIAMAYLKGGFLLDFFACLPSSTFVPLLEAYMDGDDSGAERSDSNKAIRIVRLHRIQKIAKLTRMLRLKSMENVTKNIDKLFGHLDPGSYLRQFKRTRGYRLLALLVTTIILTNLFACFWYLLAALHNDIDDTWIGRRGGDILTASPGTQWLVSMWFTFTVFTTVGYGDMSAVSPAEILYTVVMMMVGATVHSRNISEMIRLVTEVDSEKLAFVEKSNMLRAFCRHIGAQHYAKDMIRSLSYHPPETLRKEDRGTVKTMILENFFPPTLTKTIADAALDGELGKNKLFNLPCDAAFDGIMQPQHLSGEGAIDPRITLIFAIFALKRTLKQGQVVYYKGDAPRYVFLVMEGTIAAVAKPFHKLPNLTGQTKTLSPVSEDQVGLVDKLVPNPLKGIMNTKTSPVPDPEASATNPQDDDLWPYELRSRQSFFGEFEILGLEHSLDNIPRRTTMRCESETATVMVISADYFKAIQSDFPAFASAMSRCSLRREAYRQRLAKKLRYPGVDYIDLALRNIQYSAREWLKRHKGISPKNTESHSLTTYNHKVSTGSLSPAKSSRSNGRLENPRISDTFSVAELKASTSNLDLGLAMDDAYDSERTTGDKGDLSSPSKKSKQLNRQENLGDLKTAVASKIDGWIEAAVDRRLVEFNSRQDLILEALRSYEYQLSGGPDSVTLD